MDCVDLLDSDEEEAPSNALVPPVPVVPEGIRILRHTTQTQSSQSEDEANKQKQANKSINHLRLLLEESKFLQNFDPEKSSREKRKLNRKNYSASTNKNSTMYDEKGRHRESGLNLCDCLDMSCAGCHFNCPNW
jgi:hypothetical protein